MVTEGSDEMITNNKFDIPGKNSEEDASKIEQNVALKPVGDCFEVIDGFILKGTAGGLEQDVTLEECQCYCANSSKYIRLLKSGIELTRSAGKHLKFSYYDI
ncbi:hypothetical protein WUBG_17958 [Wuchereria bancrofti]|uniref:Uncharacterized protein n=1 Tax=Wuchereria bancrofti TaxID=6293 RepID=J9E2H2_WUCBA|nr:hypothetical protein WUBG_17958 [Wuchereria bancrofti]